MFQLNLERVVDRGESIRTDDLLDTKRALSDLGYYEKPTGGFADFTDDEMFEGIEAFQRDKRLRVDGMMVPDGPTVRTINAALVARGADGPANNGAGDGGGRRPHVPIGLLTCERWRNRSRTALRRSVRPIGLWILRRTVWPWQ